MKWTTNFERQLHYQDPPPLCLWRNRWTAEPEGVQLRLGTDHRWYPYRRDDTTGRWRPTAPPQPSQD